MTWSRLAGLFLLRKISGFVIFGIIPALLAFLIFGVTPVKAGLAFRETARLWPWIAGSAVFFITLNVFNSKNPGIRAVYPEMRLKGWNMAGILLAAGGWILYLAAYEYLFRGLLFFGCLSAFGLYPAVAVNISLYAALHLPKGLKEAVAAIPFGALICYLTYESRSILPAIFIHSLQAISIEMFCIYRNPDMNFQLFNKDQP